MLYVNNRDHKNYVTLSVGILRDFLTVTEWSDSHEAHQITNKLELELISQDYLLAT